MFYFVRELGTSGSIAYLCVLVRDPLGGLGYGFPAPLAAVKIVPGGTAVLAQNQKTRDQPRLVCIGSLKETSSREGIFKHKSIIASYHNFFGGLWARLRHHARSRRRRPRSDTGRPRSESLRGRLGSSGRSLLLQLLLLLYHICCHAGHSGASNGLLLRHLLLLLLLQRLRLRSSSRGHLDWRRRRLRFLGLPEFYLVARGQVVSCLPHPLPDHLRPHTHHAPHHARGEALLHHLTNRVRPLLITVVAVKGKVRKMIMNSSVPQLRFFLLT